MFDKKKRPEASVANYFKKLCVKLPVGFQSESDQGAFTDFILGTLDERAHM